MCQKELTYVTADRQGCQVFERQPAAGGTERTCDASQAEDHRGACLGWPQLCQPARARGWHQPAAAASAPAEAAGSRLGHEQARAFERWKSSQLLRGHEL